MPSPPSSTAASARCDTAAVSGLQLGRAPPGLHTPLGEVWSVHLDASMYDDQTASGGLTEAYLQFRPYPFDDLRLRVKAGAFYAPLSLENRAGGWESPYTLSYSALNSWLALSCAPWASKPTLDWLGTRSACVRLRRHRRGVRLERGRGAALADGGFMLADRQTPVFGRVGQPADEPWRRRAIPAVRWSRGHYGGSRRARWIRRRAGAAI